MGFFSSLFSANTATPEEEQKKREQKNFEILKYDGIRAQRIGRRDYALQCFREALKLKEDYETYGHLSNLLIETNRVEEAVDPLKSMIRMQPKLTNIHNTLASVYYMIEDYAAMEQVLQDALVEDACNARTHYLMGRACRSLGRTDEAIASLTKAIELQDAFVEALLLRGEIFADGKDYESALSDIEAVLSTSPADENALLLKGRIMSATGNNGEAEQAYRQVMEVDPFNQQAYLDLARLLMSQQRYSDAVEMLTDAVDMSPNFAEVYAERGKARFLSGDEEGAKADEDMYRKLKDESKDTVDVTADATRMVRQTDILGL